MLKQNVLMICFAGVMVLPGLAQKNNVQSANNMLREGRFEEAKKFIDLATEHETTANDPKMWHYRGKIYYEMHRQGKHSVDPEAIEKAAQALMKCIDLDEKEVYTKEMRQLLVSSAGMINNKAIDKLGEDKNAEAEALWLSILKILPYDDQKGLARSNLTDKTIYKNCVSAALRANNKTKAKEYLVKLMELNYNDPGIYLDMSTLLIEENNYEESLKYVEKGRGLFDDNKDLIQQQVFLYVKLDRTDDLIGKLDEELESDPEAANLLYLRGKLLESKKQSDKAEADMKKAAELDPGNFDYWYDLGVVQYNNAAEIINKANNIKDLKKYDIEKKKGDEKFRDAQSSFENARKVKSDDIDTLNQLKLTYARTNESAKYDEVVAKLKELEGK